MDMVNYVYYCYENGNGVHRLILEGAKSTQTNTTNLLQVNQQHQYESKEDRQVSENATTSNVNKIHKQQ